MLYYKLANNFKDKRKYHLSKDCFLKCFNIFKENEQYYHYSMTEILRDYCKLLVILGEIYAAEMNYKYLIQHSFIFHKTRSKWTIDCLLEFSEFKFWIAQKEAGLAYIQIANKFTNQLNYLRIFSKNELDYDLIFRVKLNICLVYFTYGSSKFKIKSVLNDTEVLIKELKVYNVKDKLSTMNENNSEEHLKEIEHIINQSMLKSKYLECIKELKEAIHILESSCKLCRKNMKIFYKVLISVDMQLINLYLQFTIDETKFQELIDEILMANSYYHENTIDRAINNLNLSDLLIFNKRIYRTYDLLNSSEKIFKNLYGTENNIYFARLYYSYGLYYKIKNDLDKAEKYFEKSLDDFNEKLGENVYSKLIRRELGEIYKKWQNSGEFKKREDQREKEKVIKVEIKDSTEKTFNIKKGAHKYKDSK